MTDFTQQELSRALDACATEPIHLIGKIQSHGALLVLGADSQHIVLQASDNLVQFFDLAIPDVCGQPLNLLLGNAATLQIVELLFVAKEANTATGKIRVMHKHALVELQAHVYFADEMFVLELERDDVECNSAHLAELLLNMQQTLLQAQPASKVSNYFDEVATLVRSLTDFDSVMVYRFDNNWDGEVISQSRCSAAPSYLGLHFPASDIPPQARRLYATNLVRIVADVDAAQVDILPSLNPLTRHPLDLSFSVLRSLSPVHIQYLKNMGVRASMSISLLQNGRLWGLIACHHFTPKRVSITLREEAVFISRMVSAQLSSIEAIEQRKQFNKTIHIVGELLKYITTDAEEAILQLLFPKLLALMDATGLLMLVEGKPYLFGEVPEPDALNALVSWLSKRPVTDVFSCDYLSKQFPPAAMYAHIAAGLIATPLSKEMRNCIIWLRPEKSCVVHWAGSAEKGMMRDANGEVQLTPRDSFAAWSEIWHGRSAPWTHVEIGIAGMLSLTLPEGLSHKVRLEQAQESQRRSDSESRIAATTFDAQEGLMVTDASGLILRVNRPFTLITGYALDEVKGKNPNILKSGRQDEAFYRLMWTQLLNAGVWEGEIWNKRKNGEVYPEYLTITAVKDQDGVVTNYVGTLRDISTQKQHEDKIAQITYQDELTQLPNRRLLAERMPLALARAKRLDSAVCIACLDLDGFKFVNDSVGRDAGDTMLIEASKRLLKCVRAEDTVARLGGDEFVLVMNAIGDRTICEQTLRRILQDLTIPFNLGGDKLAYISASIGYTLYPEDDVDADTLLRHADQAMYSAKQAGKNRFIKFDAKAETRNKANWDALARIQKALEHREFRLFIQPKVSLATGRVVGAEALIRWQHPVRGIVSPAEFLPLIENQDIAISVGDWVISQGLWLLREWKSLGLDIPISVNVSPRQLRESDFAERLAGILKIYPEVDPHLLEIEIVESAALDDIDKVSQLISECQALGVGFSLDDFGTGYSSLTYLKRLRVETLKIDQSFVRDMLTDESAQAIVRGVLGLAEAFHSHAVAEGVETWQHAARLKLFGCPTVQGYAIARPMPAEELPAWISNFQMPNL